MAVAWKTSAIKIAGLNLGYDGKVVDHVNNSIFFLKLVSAGVSVFKNVIWDQPRSQLPILNFEESS